MRHNDLRAYLTGIALALVRCCAATGCYLTEGAWYCGDGGCGMSDKQELTISYGEPLYVGETVTIDIPGQPGEYKAKVVDMGYDDEGNRTYKLDNLRREE